MSDTPEKTAREMTDTIIDTLELKIRAGKWVSLEAVRREFHTLIKSYERQLMILARQIPWEANGDEEE